ncbi:MAG TPA: hypothetical protein VEU06_00415, partial [Micropepsaceae bacterium]|nr:hypothetical protein [Micropepsaceae bacterium]
MEYAKRAEFYREQAADCRKQAAAGVTPTAMREHWLRLAESYDALAVDAMKLSRVGALTTVTHLASC